MSEAVNDRKILIQLYKKKTTLSHRDNIFFFIGALLCFLVKITLSTNVTDELCHILILVILVLAIATSIMITLQMLAIVGIS